MTILVVVPLGNRHIQTKWDPPKTLFTQLYFNHIKDCSYIVSHPLMARSDTDMGTGL